MLLAIQAEHWPVLEILQPERPQLDTLLAARQLQGPLAVLLGNERHRRLRGQAHQPWTGIGRQPELDLRAGRGIAPMPSQDEALL
ncbi:hypothetical protein D3C78_1546810 [compost metagenome]